MRALFEVSKSSREDAAVPHGQTVYITRDDEMESRDQERNVDIITTKEYLLRSCIGLLTPAERTGM
jgi:hypothetical protein